MSIFKKFFSIDNLFSKTVVLFCVGFMAFVVLRSLNILEETGVDGSNIITTATAFFGGELALMATRSIFSGKNKAKIQSLKVEAERTRIKNQ